MTYQVLRAALSQLEALLNEQAALGWTLVQAAPHPFDTINGEAEIIIVWSNIIVWSK